MAGIAFHKLRRLMGNAKRRLKGETHLRVEVLLEDRLPLVIKNLEGRVLCRLGNLNEAWVADEEDDEPFLRYLDVEVHHTMTDHDLVSDHWYHNEPGHNYEMEGVFDVRDLPHVPNEKTELYETLVLALYPKDKIHHEREERMRMMYAIDLGQLTSDGYNHGKAN